MNQRADIWAFGAVLYEMLTARRAFGGADVSEVLASVLRQDVDYSALPLNTPPAVRRLLRRCLERDVRRRLAAIADARLDLDEPDDLSIGPPTPGADIYPDSNGVHATGSLAYFSAPSLKTRAVWMDASGRLTESVNVPAGHYETVAISPDGTQAVLERSSSPSEATLWIVGLARDTASPFATGPGRNEFPVWSPDGKRIAFATDRDGPQTIVVKSVGDESPEQVLLRSDVLFKDPAAWSPDSQWLVVRQVDPTTRGNVYRMPASGGALTPIVRGPADDRGGPISPNGSWMAYTADDSGRSELFVQPFLNPGRRVQVSQGSALLAWWTPDNKALLFASSYFRVLWRAEIQPGDPIRVGAVTQLATLPPNIISMDAMPDRQRFLVLMPERSGAGSITVVQDWREDLKAREK